MQKISRLISLAFLLTFFRMSYATPLKVVSYNILSQRYLQYGNYHKLPFEVVDYSYRMEKISKYLQNLDSDIIGLQEVEKEALDILRKELEDKYKLVDLYPKNWNKDYLAIFIKKNKFKIKETSVQRYPKGKKYYQVVKIETSNKNIITIINTKIKYVAQTSSNENPIGYIQMETLLDAIKSKFYGDDIILVGDFNMEEEEKYILEIKKHLKDTHQGKHFPTININNKLRRVDYIFHSKNFVSEPVITKKIDNKTQLPSENIPSDHLPIVAYVYQKKIPRL